MLVTEAVKERAGEDAFRWSAAGEKKLKGLNKPVKTFRPRRRYGLTGTRSSMSSRSTQCPETTAR